MGLFKKQIAKRLTNLFLQQILQHSLRAVFHEVPDPRSATSRRHPLPATRSAITVRRDWSEKKDPLAAPKSHTRFFLTSLAVKEKSRAVRTVREHWSGENRNHHKRDASAWQEDRHRHRKPNAARNLTLTRNVLLALIPCAEGQPLARFFELYHCHPSQALRRLLHAPPVL